MRDKIYAVLEGDGSVAWVTQGAILALILFSVFAVIAGSVESFHQRYGYALRIFEVIALLAFSIEYIARIYASASDPARRDDTWPRVRYSLTPLALVDLLSILPGILSLGAVDLRALRALRLMRIFRLLKISRYSRAVEALGRALHSTREELGVVLFGLVILLILASTILYQLENEAQRNAFSSIPATMWWSMTVLAKAGRVEIVPMTILGKLAASGVAVLGIGLFALPAGILSAAFLREIAPEKSCHNCGGKI